MDEVAISAHGLSKQYAIGNRLPKWNGLKRTTSSGPGTHEQSIWALRDVSFELNQGEVLGIIGRNGSGKSTLLKILSRITKPTTGDAKIHGRIGSLLEVGTGFHPELTGRENIRLNGAVLGMRQAEITRHFDAIVAFAEVEKFIDTPVKRYSSGMYMRLAFAVAAHLQCEILLVDEVLAVGDFAFQQKCLSKMDEVSKAGRTVLFVSHNIAAVLNLCTEAILLDEGRMGASGTPRAVVDEYLNGSRPIDGEAYFSDPYAHTSTSEFKFLAVRVLDERDQPTAHVDLTKGCRIEIEYAVHRPITGLQVGFELWAGSGICVLCTTDLDWGPIKHAPLREQGIYRASCRLEPFMFRPGRYWIGLGASVPGTRALDEVPLAISFEVVDTGSVEFKLTQGRRGAIAPILKWKSTTITREIQ